MPKVVEVPGIGNVEFPDSMSDADVSAQIRKSMAPPSDATRSVPDMVSNAASHFGGQIAGAVTALPGAIAHPIDAVKNISDSLDDLRNKAVAAYRRGDYKEAAVHALGSFVPGFGPGIDKAGMEALHGDYSGAIGDTTGMAALALAPKIAKESAPLVEAAAPIVRDAVVEGVKAGVKPTEVINRFGVSVKVPASVASGAVGGAAARITGLPAWTGAVPGAIAPIVTGAVKGVKAGRAARAVAEQRAAGRTPVWQGPQPEQPAPVEQTTPAVASEPAALPSGRVPGRFDPENPPVADWRERLQQLGVKQQAQPLASVPPVEAQAPAPQVEAPAPQVEAPAPVQQAAAPTPMEATPAPAPEPAPIVAPQPEPAPVIPPKAATRELPNPVPVKDPKIITGSEFETAARYAKAQALAKFLYAEGDGVPHESALKMDPKQWEMAQKGAGVAGPPSPKTIKMALDELKKLEVSQPIARQMADALAR